jgi:copper chaperone CopZ
MTAPGSLSRSMHPTQGVVTHGTPGAAGILEAKAAGMQPGMMKSGLEALSKGSEFLTGAAKTLQDNPFSVPGLKAAAIPFAQGTADVMYAEGQRDLKDLAKDVVDDMGEGYTDDAYRAAIRKSMTAYGATEEEILEAIEAAGYRSGGKVTPKRGLVDGPGGYAGEVEFGGITAAVENVDGKEKEKITEAYDSESDMSQWRIGDYRPFKYTGAIDDMWKLNLDEGSPLEYIFKIGMTVRAPLIDVIRGMGKTAAETAKLIAAAGELGWDLTKPAREILGDIGSAGLEGTKWALGQSDKTRYIQPNYWITRAAGDMSDDEARLSMQDTKVGDFRKDKDLIKKLENRLMDEKVGESPDQISMEEVELYPGRGEKTSRMSLRADGGRINKAEGGMPSVLPKGIEADYRGGGFIPIGSRERADDVPARLSENEFVMTADAVRAAGGGSVNRGAKRMYDLMHNLEARA